MKEVTRIHIAKVSYEIELAAKKQLESYIDALTNYADDENVIEDIEIRVTELLDARGVKAGGIITIADVESIQETLGEPKDFSGEGDFAIGDDENSARHNRKYYRDIDNAVLGGVLSGLAAYLNVNALWVRLLFVVLVFVSFGFAVFVYALLWIITPPAKTVTDKLLMKGEPVTLGSIRRYNEDQVGVRSTKELLERRRRAFGVVIGIVGGMTAAGAAIATIGGVAAWTFLGTDYREYTNRWEILSLLITSGVLLTLLGIIISYAGFAAKATKRIIVIICAVIVAGILSFSGGVGLIGYQAWQHNDKVQKSISERSVTLPNDFVNTKQLVVDAENVYVTYQVSGDSRATFTSVPGPKATVTKDGDKAVLRVTGTNSNEAYMYRPTITIYGPQLSDIEVQKGSVDYAAKNQELKTTVANSASLSLSGNYLSLDATAKESANLSADGATIRSAKVALEPSSSISLGTVESLEATVPTACPNGAKAQISVQGITAGSYTANGAKQLVATQDNACWTMSVAGDDRNGVPGL